MSTNLDKDFFLPSQFENNPDSPEHYRFKSGLVFTYKRNNELIAHVDFSDLALSEDIIKDLQVVDNLTAQIHKDASQIADLYAANGDGKKGQLQVGDIEYINDVQNRILTKEDIELIADFHLQNESNPNFTVSPVIELTDKFIDQQLKQIVTDTENQDMPHSEPKI